MFFDYKSGYQASDLLGQIRSESKVAREMGLERRSVLLERMENLVCHFHGCNYIGAPVIEPTNGMASSLIKMKMANEARKILSSLESPKTTTQQDKTKKRPTHRKIYTYPCHICNKEYNHIANHLKHAHKLKPQEINQAKRKRQEGKESIRSNTFVKRSLKPCPLKGCSWLGRRFDYHLPRIHNIKKGSKKYLDLICDKQ